MKSSGVYQWIQPITLFDKDFKDKINHGSDEAIASTMEHAIRHAISVKMKDNPVHYQSLLERLLQILEETNMNWEDRRRQLEEFIEREMSHGEEDTAKKLGFTTKRQLAIFETVKSVTQGNNEAGAVSYSSLEDEDAAFKEITLAIEETIKDSRVLGFKNNPTRVNEMETAIYNMLLTKYYSALGFETIRKLISPIIELAKIHYDGQE